LDHDLVILESSYDFAAAVPPVGRVGWRLDQNSLAPIFKVDFLLERTIHLDHDLVILESSDDFAAAVPPVGRVGQLSRPKLTCYDLQSECFIGNDYPFGP